MKRDIKFYEEIWNKYEGYKLSNIFSCPDFSIISLYIKGDKFILYKTNLLALIKGEEYKDKLKPLLNYKIFESANYDECGIYWDVIEDFRLGDDWLLVNGKQLY